MRAGFTGGGLTLGLNPTGKVIGTLTEGVGLLGDDLVLTGDLLLERDRLLDLSSLDLLFLSVDDDLR